MASPKKHTISLDELSTGRLPPRIIEAISKMEITIGELEQCSAEKQTIRILITDKHFYIEVRKRYSITKAVATVSGVAGIVWVVIEFALPYIFNLT